MLNNKCCISGVCAALMLLGIEAHAAMAVIDVRAITQLRSQIQAMERQLQTAREHLSQAQAQYQAMTGNRGMDRLLSGTVRNYLPSDWAALSDTLENLSASYSALSSQLRSLMHSNAVLSDEQLGQLSPSMQQAIVQERQMTAMTQAIAREALARTSQRFTSIQQLIDTIPQATDEKAILDLNSRIAAEQAMLQNEHTKLHLLNQTLASEALARQQRARERAIADIGSFKRLPPLELP